MAYDLIQVSTLEEWDAYHRIRREELFEARGRSGLYDATHPDEHKVGNTPLLLKKNGLGVATTRFDKINEITAVIRLVAVTKSMQGTGLGRILMERTAFLARTRGYARIVVNAASSAIGFYKRVGFLEEIWDPAELPGNAIATTQMALYLEGSRNTD